MHVLRMTPQDVPEVHSMEERLFDQAFSERQLQAELREGGGLIAKEGDTTLGYCLLRTDHQLVEITRLAVSEDARRKGCGKALLRAAVELAGEYTVFLQVAKKNTPALLLYRAHGFKVAGESGATWAMVLRKAEQPADCFLIHHP